MSHITVVFTRRRALGSALIRAWMHSRFSHCGLVDPARNTVIEATLHGVRERSLSLLLAESSYHELVQIPCHNPLQALAVARGQLGKPYDWKGVLGFWFRRDWRDERAFFCSELVAWVLEVVGQPAFRKQAHRISPETLYLPLFER